MDKKNHWTVEKTIFLSLAILAFGLRLISLMNAPISDREAVVLLQAEQLLNQMNLFDFAPQQVLLTNWIALFSAIFGSAALFGRLIPAFAGSVIVFMPYYFKERLGRNTAIAVSTWLVIDPLLFFLSRKVDSTVISVLLFVIAVLCIKQKKSIAFGIVFGLGLLSGAQFVFAALLLLFVLWINRENPFVNVNSLDFKAMVLSFITVLVLVGSNFFLHTKQFGAVLSGIVNLIVSPVQHGSIPLGESLLGLVIYEGLAVAIGIVSLFFYWKTEKKTMQCLLTWFVLFILYFVLTPVKTASLLVWLVLPLGIIAIKFIISKIKIEKHDQMGIYGFGTLFFVFMVFLILFLLSGPATSGANVLGVNLSGLLIILFVVVLIISIIVFVAWAWSPNTVFQSVVLAVIGVTVILSTSSAMNLGGVRETYQNELWHLGHLSPDLATLEHTLDNLVDVNGANKEDVKVYIDDIESPALYWVLRDFDVHYGAVKADDNLADIIITNYDDAENFQGAFRGEDYELKSTAAWNLMTIPEWKTWFMSRQAPEDGIKREMIVVWVNNNWFAAR